MSLDFTGKTVAVSGAAIGFGAAIGARFAQAGAQVFGCDILDGADTSGLSMAKVDLLDRKAGADWIKSIEERTGRAIDVLVCNAGGVAGPAMKSAGRGAIVTITSGAALQASLTGVQAYCSAKHALLGLTRQLAH